MSLYNALFGTNSYAKALLMTLGLTEAKIPRFRDCYLDEAGQIVILTRTGGGNRLNYESPEGRLKHYPELYDDIAAKQGPFNEDLRKIAGYLSDEDDDFDSTYARFYFQPNDEFADCLKEIAEKQGKRNPMKEFRQLIQDMQEGKQTPATKRALAVAERIVGEIMAGKPTIKV